MASCQKENVIQPQENGPEKKHFEVTFNEEENARMILLRGDYSVSEADLLNQAKSFAQSLSNDETKTKEKSISRMPVLVDSLVEVKSIATKSGAGPQEAKVYVVSFGKEAGYAFFAGDKRAGGLLGFVGEGDFDADTDNPGLRFTYGCMTQYVASEVERMEGLCGDSLYNAMAEQYAPLVSDKPQTKVYMPVFNGIEWIWTEVDDAVHLPEEYVYSFNIHVPELLQTYWGQWAPFNKYINDHVSFPYNPNLNYPVGCVATAVAQIMNYHKYPNSYGGTVFQWNNYLRFKEEWADYIWYNGYDGMLTTLGVLHWYLGNNDNLQMSYAPDGSGANDKRVPPTLRNFGYNCSWVEDYNISTVLSNIGNRRPVYLSGDNGQIMDYHGHAWVGDGSASAVDTVIRKTVYYYQGHEVGYDIQKGATNSRNFIHCNWGWEERKNANVGYYAWIQGNLFTPEQHNYKHNVKMVVDIYPK